MTPDLQNTLTEFEEKPYPFATITKRGVACLLDEILLLVLSILNTYGLATLKSPVLFTLVVIITGIYRPFFDTRYGATPGKMLLQIKVVNTSFKPLVVTNGLLRNSFNIAVVMYTLTAGLIVFSSDDFIFVNSYSSFTKLEDTLINHKWISVPYCIVFITEIICVLADKQRRSLHDFIGGTLVINKPQPSAQL